MKFGNKAKTKTEQKQKPENSTCVFFCEEKRSKPQNEEEEGEIRLWHMAKSDAIDI